MDFTNGSGTRIWADHPQREERLLKWFDEQPEYTKSVFVNTKRGVPPKRRGSSTPILEFYRLAANAVFSVDENPVFREQLREDPHHFMTSIRFRISSWKKKYHEFNLQIGETASNTAFEEIQVGSQVHEVIMRELRNFPLWTRLHAHWRTLPKLNPFYRSAKTSTHGGEGELIASLGSSPRPAKRRRGATIEATKSESDETSDYSPSPDPETDSDVICVDGPYDVEEVKEPASEIGEGIAKPKLNRLKRKCDDNNHGQITSASHIEEGKGNDMLTASQKHERELAELAIKLRTLENEALEKKTTLELRRLEIEAEERRRTAEQRLELIKVLIMAMGKAVSGEAAALEPVN